MSPLVTPTTFSHKYTEKQLYIHGVNDKASWLNSPLPGLLWPMLACRKIVYILTRRNFLLRSLHTAQDTKPLNLIFQSLKTCLRKHGRHLINEN